MRGIDLEVSQGEFVAIEGLFRPKARQGLASVGLGDRGKEWPAVLSGGQRQRVALARALVSEPRLLLLDEPLGALDAVTRVEMQQLLERLWQEQGFTGFLITHDVEEAVVIADRVVLIEAGQVALNIPVDLPRPRQRGSAVFAKTGEKLVQRVLGQHEKAASMNVTQSTAVSTIAETELTARPFYSELNSLNDTVEVR